MPKRLQPKPKKKKRPTGLRRAGRTLYRTLVLLSAVIVALFVAWKVWVRPPMQAAPPVVNLHPNRPAPTDDPDTADIDESQATPTPLVRRDGVYTFLLTCPDQASGNADAIMAVAYDTNAQTVGLVSIPRDTLVHQKGYSKINHALLSGGVEELRDVVADLTGVPVDFYVEIDLKLMKQLLEEVGGVDFYVPCDMDYDDPTQDLSIHYKKGQQYLTAQQAMEVCRFRKNNDGSGYSDVGRTQTTQKMMVAVAKRVLSWSNIPKFNRFVDIFTQNIKTNMSASDIAYFVSKAPGVDLESGVTLSTLPGDGTVTYRGTSWCYELYPQETLDILNQCLNPYTTELTLDMTNIFQA